MQKLSRTLSATDNPKNSDYVLKQPKLHPKPKFFRFTFDQLFDHSSEAAGFFSYKKTMGDHIVSHSPNTLRRITIHRTHLEEAIPPPFTFCSPSYFTWCG
jgi:hypothetical protein